MQKHPEEFYDQLHAEIALNLGLTPRDVRFFRVSHFAGNKDVAAIKAAMLKKLPGLIKGKSPKADRYKKRLEFLNTITPAQWDELVKVVV